MSLLALSSQLKAPPHGGAFFNPPTSRSVRPLCFSSMCDPDGHAHSLPWPTFDLEIDLGVFSERLQDESTELALHWPGRFFRQSDAIVSNHDAVAGLCFLQAANRHRAIF